MQEEQLNDEQKKQILEYWDVQVFQGKPPKIQDITNLVFGEGTDGRSKEGRLIKEYLASLQLTVSTSADYEPKKYELTEPEKEYVKNNRAMMSSYEMAKTLFKGKNITNTSAELKAVDEHNLSFGPYEHVPQQATAHEDWKPPVREDGVISRVNRYFEKGGGIDVDKVTAMQKKEMVSLLRYLNTYRLKSQINVYDDKGDRELFESTFIRYTYDKSDLLEEEVDQYILLCNEIVLQKKTQKRYEKLQKVLDQQTGEGDDGEGAKISMSLAEMIGKVTVELNACSARQEKLYNSLKQKRSERLSSQIKQHASILNLLAYWKIQKTRVEFIELAEKRKLKVKEEIDRLSSMEDVMCRIIGISEGEALNG